MQHLQYGINSVSKFVKALSRIIFPVPSFRPALPSFPLVSLHLRFGPPADHARATLLMILLCCIVLYCLHLVSAERNRTRNKLWNGKLLENLTEKVHQCESAQ